MIQLFIALLTLSPLSHSASAAVPTFTLHCEADPTASLQAKLDLNATRQTDFISAEAEVTYLDLVKPGEWTQTSTRPFRMLGQFEDGRSLLLIKLKPDYDPLPGTLPNLLGILLDLSYDYSVSHLVMSDGTDFLLHCKVLP